ncbi:histidine kinase [Ancylomarina sp. YFZ004]
MKTKYLNQSLYRIFAPLVAGLFVYVLILLVFDRLSEIINNFQPDELVFLILVNYILFETYRVWINSFEKSKRLISTQWLKTGFLFIGSFIITITEVSVCLWLYFNYYIGISSFGSQLISLLIVFILVGILFHLFYISISFLDKQNTLLLQKEEVNQKNIQYELEVFRNKINPDFLYNALEGIISLIRKENVDLAEKHIDYLALFYRRILGNRYSEVISLEDEIKKIEHYLEIQNYLYAGNLSLEWDLNTDTKEIMIVPNTVLQAISLIEQTQLVNSNTKLNIIIEDDDSYICFKFKSSAKLKRAIKPKALLESINHSISFYSNFKATCIEDDKISMVKIPKIELENH